jgi:hypothetical protein
MTDTKPKYANFPEPQQKVVIGPNINAGTIKTLSRLSIGTYEMSFVQQERAMATTEAARSALNVLSRAMGLTLSTEAHRDYVAWLTAASAEHQFQIWISTPFELTQSGHLIWCKYVERTGDQRIGIAYKFSTGFTIDDITALIKAAQKAAVVLGPDEPFVLKGNPPPRFTKKVAAEAAPATGDAAAPDGEATPSGGTSVVSVDAAREAAMPTSQAQPSGDQ